MQQLRYRLSKTPVRIPYNWYRHRGLRRSDVFLASYPRSGSTWTRFMLYEALTGTPAEFEPVIHTIQYIGSHHNTPALLPDNGRMIKTHEPWRKEYRQAIYIVRDVRDVVLSEYRYRKMRFFYDQEFDLFLNEFLNGEVSGLGFWADQVNGWLDAGDAGRCERLLLVKFEELRRDPASALTQMAEFLRVPVTSDRIHQAVEGNSAASMREKEDRARHTVFKTYRKDLRHVNQGATGGWRDVLTSDQVRRMEERTGDTLRRLGYELT